MAPLFEPPQGRTPLPGEWAAEAACRGWPTRWWYPDWRNEQAREAKISTAAALHICRDLCPVRNECLEHAVRYREPGVWGGTTEAERRRHRKAS